MSLDGFHPIVARWFAATFGSPTAAQRRGWEAIRSGRHTLIAAPTGSGKTFAAFLTAIDQLVREGQDGALPDETRVVYVSPLKALSADIHKNLMEPRAGVEQAAAALGMPAARITAAVRTGDTPQSERAAMLAAPPHILVTTPESLYLLLTAERSRAMLRTVRTVIVDEIHAVIGTRRGAHLALSLERLQQVAAAPLLRIGLSATQKPIASVAAFLTGASGPCAIVDEGHRRAMDLGVEVPRSALEAVMSAEVWQEYYDRLTELTREHRTTLVFVNTRRMAERIARHLSERLGPERVMAHHGSLSKELRLEAEGRLKGGQLDALVATASLELGIDIGHVDLVCQIGSPRRIATLLQRVGRSGHTIAGMPKGRIFPTSRDDLLECAAMLRAARAGELDAIVRHDAPLDVLAQQVVAEASAMESTEDELFDLVRRAEPYHALSRADFDAVLGMVSDGFSTRRGRRSALLHRDEVQRRVRGRRGSRLLAITSGGAIPEVADYRVVLDPDDTFIGTLNEDFAIESSGGDVFQLGNASWRVLQVGPGVVRVADARGTPPNLPFWLGEAPARSDELSRAVSDLRSDIGERLARAEGLDDIAAWLAAETGLTRVAADQAVAYLDEGRRALGTLPTQQTIVLERFFDESGGMQLVLHAPFGARVNKAWGLALRKRFCRQFNFELQAAATDDALLLSLGPQHSFPLSDVFRYLHPATTRDVLVQAFLDAPVFPTRWRWNTTIALAVPRRRGGRKVAPQLQRMLADDLLAAAFPDAAACLENIPGDREIPDHPLVQQTVRDCLEEAMDFPQLATVLESIHAGAIHCEARDTPEPSPLAHEILNARPYAFLDDAPLEERRTHAVYARRAGEPGGSELGALDADAIARVRAEQRLALTDRRDADEMHDALVTIGFLRGEDVDDTGRRYLAELATMHRAGVTSVHRPGSGLAAPTRTWVAAERSTEWTAIHPATAFTPSLVAPPLRAARVWTREEAIVELLRGRLTIAGPTTAATLAAELGVTEADASTALLALEADGVVLRGRFEPAGAEGTQWCDRGLLARIHRYTINRLRAEIEPVSPADFMRFLFIWQHAHPSARLTGVDGLRAVLNTLDGFEAPAAAWERSLLPTRLDKYDPALLDMLSLTGEVAWARVSRGAASADRTTSPAPGLSMPVALFIRDHANAWLTSSEIDEPRAADAGNHVQPPPGDEAAGRLLEALQRRGASFVRDLRLGTGLTDEALSGALAQLVGAGAVTSDSFAGLRALIRSSDATRPGSAARAGAGGRWSLVDELRAADGTEEAADANGASAKAARAALEAAADVQARALLRRYGVVCRRLLAREACPLPWRVLVRVYRRLEARGDIRGGRFVNGFSGEQFASPEAIEQLRAVRRTAPDGILIPVSAADPLNLAGIAAAGDRVRAVSTNRVLYRDGVAIAALEGEYLRPLISIEPAQSAAVATALAGRAMPAISEGFVGRV